MQCLQCMYCICMGSSTWQNMYKVYWCSVHIGKGKDEWQSNDNYTFGEMSNCQQMPFRNTHTVTRLIAELICQRKVILNTCYTEHLAALYNFDLSVSCVPTCSRSMQSCLSLHQCFNNHAVFLSGTHVLVRRSDPTVQLAIAYSRHSLAMYI